MIILNLLGDQTVTPQLEIHFTIALVDTWEFTIKTECPSYRLWQYMMEDPNNVSGVGIARKSWIPCEMTYRPEMDQTL